MSFESENHYFLAGLVRETKNKTEKEKIKYYNLIKIDALDRLHKYFGNANNPLSIQQKIDGYIEALYYFKDYEFEYILYSIYFDKDASFLLASLSQKLISDKPSTFNDKFLILNFLKNQPVANYNIDRFLKNIFNLQININDNDWRSKNDPTTNPIEHKIVNWLNVKMNQQNTNAEILYFLFHYTKYWNEFVPSIQKSVILLDKMNVILKAGANDFQTNINDCFQSLYDVLQNVFYNIIPIPFLDSIIGKYDDEKLYKTFKVKILAFNIACQEIENLFSNYKKLSFSDLIGEYFDSETSLNLQEKILDTIDSKLNNGEMPQNEDFQYFIKEIFPNMNSIHQHKKFVKYFIKRNYLFDLI